MHDEESAADLWAGADKGVLEVFFIQWIKTNLYLRSVELRASDDKPAEPQRGSVTVSVQKHDGVEGFRH